MSKGIGKAEWAKMWDDRARRMGAAAVGHVAWSADEFDASTRDWWRDIISAASSALYPKPASHDVLGHVLDYGCGIGRFSQRWATMSTPITGVDVSRKMLQMAAERVEMYAETHGEPHGLQFKLIQPGKPIPLEDNSVGTVFTSTVLQHIPDTEFDAVVAELRRVLKPGGLVVIFENIHTYPARTSTSGHVVFRAPKEYEAAFPGIIARSQRVVKGEAHCTFSGRVE